MRRIISKILVLLLLIGFLVPGYQPVKTLAASGTVTISVSKTEVEKGGSFNVTITVSSDTPLEAYMVRVNYDDKALNCSGLAGVIDLDYESNEIGQSVTNKTYSYTFTALEATNAASISVTSAKAVTTSLEEIDLGAVNSTVKIVDHVASGNANLTGIQLSTGYLWPEFTTGNTVYAVGLDNSITSLTISCPTADPNARVSFDSNLLKDLKVGQTDVPITVTAENGTVKKYTLQVVRYAKEDETQAPTENTTLDNDASKDNNLHATVSGKEYTVVRDISSVQLPEGYELSVEKYESSDIAVAKNDITKLELAYLLDDEANGAFYIYDVTKKTFEKYITVNNNSKGYIILTPDNTLTDTKSVKVDIGGINTMAYVKNDVEDIYFFYGMNSEGVKGWYGFDAKEGTIQRMYNISEKLEEAVATSDDLAQNALKNEVSKLRRENASLKASSKRNGYKVLSIIVSLIVVVLVIYIIYLLNKLSAQKKENATLSDETKEIKKQLDETMDLVAYTEEKFARESVEEKRGDFDDNLSNISKNIAKEAEKAMSVEEDVLKSEIDKALDRLSKDKIENDSDFKFNFTDEDKYGKI